jgi:hypothetical protein
MFQYERDSTERALIIGNFGDTILNWIAIENPPANWLSEEPENGSVEPGSYMNVILHFDGNIAPGNYQTKLLILSNDPDDDTIEIPIYFQVLNIPEPDISITPTSFSITLTQGEDSSLTLRITNSGDAALTWNIYDSLSVEWLTISPKQGIIPENNYEDVNLYFNPDRLAPGTYNTILNLLSNDPFDPIIYIPCQLNVIQGLTNLSGTIYNIAFNENFGKLDSSGFVASGYVTLTDTSGTILGPVITNNWGNYNLSNVPIGDYSMHIYKLIDLPQNLPVNKFQDTVNIFLPHILLNPGTNFQNGFLPVRLIHQNYQILSNLAKLNLIIPEWNITIPLDSSYKVDIAQSLIDNWTENLDTLKTNALARLYLSLDLLNETFNNLSYYGTEGVVGLAEILTLLIAMEDYVVQSVEKVVGENEKLLVKYYLYLLNQYFQQINKSLIGLLPNSLRREIDKGYCQIFVECVDNVTGNNYNAYVKSKFSDYTRNVLFSNYYIKQRTQNLLNNAIAYTDSQNYTGNLRLAFTIMDYNRRIIKQNLETEKDRCKNKRTSLSIPYKTEDICDTFEIQLGMKKIMQTGNILKVLDFSSYIPAIASLISKFAEIPDILNDVIYRIYYPEGTLSSKLENKITNKFIKNDSGIAQQIPLEDYSSIIKIIRDILKSKDRNSLIKIIPQLIETDKNFNSEVNKILSRIYSVSNIAKDSVENYVEYYSALIRSLENSYTSRIWNLFYLVDYIINPSVENMNRAYYHLDTLMQANLELSLQIENITDKISSIPLPPILTTVIEVNDDKLFIENNDSINVKVFISNPGSVTAQNINLIPIITSGLTLINQPQIPFFLEPGEEKEILYVLRYTGSERQLGGFAILVNSQNSFNLSSFEPIPVIPDITPSTKGKLTSKNVYCFKNPFNPEKEGTIIRFSLSHDAKVTIKIFDGANNEVITLIDSYPMKAKVEQRIKWSGRNNKGEIVANGVYYALITTDKGERAVCKIAVIR